MKKIPKKIISSSHFSEAQCYKMVNLRNLGIKIVLKNLFFGGLYNLNFVRISNFAKFLILEASKSKKAIKQCFSLSATNWTSCSTVLCENGRSLWSGSGKLEPYDVRKVGGANFWNVCICFSRPYDMSVKWVELISEMRASVFPDHMIWVLCYNVCIQ